MRALPLFALFFGCTSLDAPTAPVQAPTPSPHFDDHWSSGSNQRAADLGTSKPGAHGADASSLEVEHLPIIPMLFGGIQ